MGDLSDVMKECTVTTSTQRSAITPRVKGLFRELDPERGLVFKAELRGGVPYVALGVDQLARKLAELVGQKVTTFEGNFEELVYHLSPGFSEEADGEEVWEVADAKISAYLRGK